MKTKPAARSSFDSACWTLNATPPVRRIRHARFTPLVPLLLLLATFNLSAATFMVSLESTNPLPPYSTWATAATNIQDAVDAAKAGDVVLVTNGVYAVGSRGNHAGESRVVVTNAIRLESVNGPSVTIIAGTGYGGVRCVYLGTNAVLSGFTLTNGFASHYGAGVYCEASGVVTNCTLTGNEAGVDGPGWYAEGGGVYGGTLYNCTLSGNVAYTFSGEWLFPADQGNGGGAYGGTLYNCTLSGNWAGVFGGGADGCTLYNCTLSGNYSYWLGGGASGCMLYNCTVTGNFYGISGCTLYDCIVTGNQYCGAGGSTLYNCMVTGNSGSGTEGSTLDNCAVTGNAGGGACGGALYNCTVTGNDGGGVITHSEFWGGAYPSSSVFNSIVYYNSGGNYDPNTTLNYCCTTPMPTNGVGNITGDPRFVNADAGNYHLRPNSPCIDAGTNLLSLITTDLEGEFRPWDGNRDGVAAFDIGAYEFRPSAATLYVSLQNATPVLPYSTWATAATNIQNAVDAAKAGDVVLVTNGVYAVGSRGNHAGESRVVVTNAIRLESVNGPLVTTIHGEWNGDWYDPTSVRCVYLGTNAVLSGLTLTNGRTSEYGGGVYCEPSGVVTNCTLTGNWAVKECDYCGGEGGASGGGAYGGTLYDCTLTGNISCGISMTAYSGLDTYFGGGGGASGSTLINCTLRGNSASDGGGALGSTLINCTLVGNSAIWGPGGASGSTLYNCTVTVNPDGGASGSTLINCTVTGNAGGGAWYSTLINCTVTGNSGGGAAGSVLYNCTVTDNAGGGVNSCWDVASTVYDSIVYYNSGGNYDPNTSLNYCCTTPLPTNGVGNITGPPLFTDWYGGDFRLREESPCIDSGTNLVGLIVTILRWNGWRWDTVFVPYTYEPTDILGNTRFIDGDFDGIGAWDIGAYEFNSFPPPRFSSPPRLTVNGWQLSITGAPNKWVRVQRSSDLRNWETPWWLGELWMDTEGVKHLTDRYADPRMMFYRVVVE